MHKTEYGRNVDSHWTEEDITFTRTFCKISKMASNSVLSCFTSMRPGVKYRSDQSIILYLLSLYWLQRILYMVYLLRVNNVEFFY